MVKTITRIALLTLLWAALQGSFGIGTLLLGGAFAVAVLSLARPLFEQEETERRSVLGAARVLGIRFLWTLVLILVFLRELTTSALQVALIVVRPSMRVRPGVVAYPLDVRTDREITVLANLISLTPGTLSLDVAPDRSELYIHAIATETDDGAEVVRDIKGSLEEYVRRALGPRR